MKTRATGLACVLLLGQLAQAQTEALDALLGKIQGPEAAARAAAAAELVRLTQAKTTLDPQFSERATPVLLGVLDDPDLNVRRDALTVITRLDLTAFLLAQTQEYAVQRLVASLDVPAELERDPRTLLIRIDAINVLGVCGMPAVLALMDVLESGDPKLRYQAAVSLGNIGPPAKEAVLALSQLMSDSNRKVSRAAEEAIARIEAQ